MKKFTHFISLIPLLLTPRLCNAQSFLNGSFENNISVGCDYNNTDSIFNTKMTNVHAFGKGYAGSLGGFVGETDILTFGCSVNPQNGSWCIGLSSDTFSTVYSDAVALKLTSNLIIGNAYQLSFYIYRNTSFPSFVSDIQIGESLSDTSFGNLIYQATPVSNIWTQNVFNFYATQPTQFITARIVAGVRAWNQIDNFTITNVTGINVLNNNEVINVYPNPVADKLNIKSNNSKSTEVILYDITSRKLMQQEFTSSVSLNTNQLPKGIYLYEVRNKNGVIKKGKVVKD